MNVSRGTGPVLNWGVYAVDDELDRLAPGTVFMAVFDVQDELVVEGNPPERRRRGEYAWPWIDDRLEPRLVAEGQRFASRMLWFLKDRAELARVLLAGTGDEPGQWRRDGIVATRFSGAASGLVQATILARLIGDAELERMARAKLDAAADVEVAEYGGPFSAAVGYFATKYGAWSPVDLSDLSPPA
ncbi:hypothetical protein GCM10022255_080780 [Dactylosporangium darangshiense]|uniref:Uncharacterized protein n=1 Tax=Dactylosporangium darangshiense TaxID=579108 RepID=A0ABP8DLB7_9ACTN